MEDRAARRYAHALFLAAEAEGAVDRVEADLVLLSGLWASAPDFAELLLNPEVGRREKREFLDRLFPGVLHDLARRFLDLLLVKKRVGILPDAVRDYHDFAEAHRGRSEAEVVTRFPLTPDQRHRLVEGLGRITGTQVRLVENLDPAVLGGVRVQIRDRVIDRTLRFHLGELRDALLGARLTGPAGGEGRA